MAKDNDDIYDYATEDFICLGKYEVVRETHRAIRVKPIRIDKDVINLLMDEDAFWLPKIILHPEISVSEDGDIGDLTIRKWWYEKNA